MCARGRLAGSHLPTSQEFLTSNFEEPEWERWRMWPENR